MVERRDGVPLAPDSLDARRVAHDLWVVQNSVLGQDAHTSYTGWVITGEGAVVIDPGNFRTCQMIKAKIAGETGKAVRYIVYTHAHGDHTMGAAAFADQSPKVIAHGNAIARLNRYAEMAEYIRRINSIQFHFNIPPVRFPSVYPTDIYRDEFEFALGGLTFQLFHAKGETDDHSLVWIPEMKTVFCGDLLEASFPNLGNPFKVLRYGREWVDALEKVLSLAPDFAIGGDIVVADRVRLEAICRDNIELLRFLEQAVIKAANEGKNLEEMIEEIQLPPHLQDSPNLKQVYSRREFTIHNIWRRYCGYFDFSPSGLLPRPKREVAEVVRGLIGNDAAILARVTDLLGAGRPQLALEVLDIILRTDQQDVSARRLRLDILHDLASSDGCLMSRNVWVHYMEEDEEFLKGKA